MKGYMETSQGVVQVNKEVIAKYAGSVAVECFGIIGMAMVSVTDGIVKLLKREKLAYGVDVKIDKDNKITIDFHVIISYGVNIGTVAQNLVENVKYKVEAFCNMDVKKINVYVEGVRRID